MHDHVTAIEEGIFGLTNVKLGDNGKERGILLRNVHGFRRALLTGVLLLAALLGCIWLYSRRVQQANIELAASSIRNRSTKCRAAVEGILLKQDEIDELCRRLQQRQVLDHFLSSERKYEKELQTRLTSLIKSGPESLERQVELEKSLHRELEWFTDAVGDAVESIIEPLDRAFEDIPRSIQKLQAELRAELPAFGQHGSDSMPGICADLSVAIVGSTLEHNLAKRLQLLISGARNSTSELLDQGMLAKLTGVSNATLVQDVPVPFVKMLLKWYSTASVAALSSALLAADHVPQATVEVVENEDDDPEDDGNEDDDDDDDDDPEDLAPNPEDLAKAEDIDNDPDEENKDLSPTLCAHREGTTCKCIGKVFFGKKFASGKPGSGAIATFEVMKKSRFKKKAVLGEIQCADKSFGDPAPGFEKHCYCLEENRDAGLDALSDVDALEQEES